MTIRISVKQQEALRQMRDVLQDGFLTTQVTAYTLEETMDSGTCVARVFVRENGGAPFEVTGDGVGMVDAIFNGLLQRYAREYPSLRSIHFTSFAVRGLIEEKDAAMAAAHAGASRPGSPGVGPLSSSAVKSNAEATVGVRNSYGTEFEFGAVTSSVSRSTVEAVVSAVEYFVNSERAWVTMYRALKHYKTEGRQDLVEKYTKLLAEIVRNTSYSEVIERETGSHSTV